MEDLRHTGRSLDEASANDGLEPPIC
jgi:hypothetical protein